MLIGTEIKHKKKFTGKRAQKPKLGILFFGLNLNLKLVNSISLSFGKLVKRLINFFHTC